MLSLNKSYRVRVVIDVSAKINKACLNDNLLPGIDLLNNLVSVTTKTIRYYIAKWMHIYFERLISPVLPIMR